MDETVVTPAQASAPAPPSRLRRWLRRLAIAVIGTVILGSGAAIVGLIVISQDLPEIRSLNDYHPPQATVVYGSKGELVARFAKERRTVVPFERIPKIMVEAVIASEDDTFFEHEGLDYVGIARCAVKNLLSGRKVCGGSTITQQTVKTFFLNPKKTYTRKLREMILARRIEQALSKDDILFLYLNQIYYGHGAYGIQEAARVYFGKDVSSLTIEQAALLAGLPQSPSRLDPYRHPERALDRRAYVLKRLHDLKRIDDATYQSAREAPLDLDWAEAEADINSNNHYAAHVRSLLERMVGEDRTVQGGLKVYTGLNPRWQRTAENAVRSGLRELDKRQGWRGPVLHLEADELKETRRLLSERWTKIARKKSDESRGPVIWNLNRLENMGRPLVPEQVAKAARFPRFALESIFAGLVIKVDDATKEAVVALSDQVHVHLPLRTGLSWARKFDLHRYTRRPRRVGDVLKTGDVVLVRATAEKPAKKGEKAPAPHHYLGVLEQTPKAQAALVAIDPHSREVRALVGGYGIGAGTFNRAVQARRQAGSTFKPFVYASAFESLSFTPITACLDAPRVYRDPWTGRSWKPQNYGKTFDGEITLRTALTKSKNLCSVELIDKVGVDAVLQMAKRAGIKSALPRNLTLALGSGDVTPLEMVNAYATLATGGQRADPLFVRKVTSGRGETIVQHEAKAETTIRPEITYQITSLMQSVVEDGTAQRVKVLERPIAGKTGTTNEARNAWFIGFTPDLVVGVWVGFDNNDPLGPAETGGRAAIPIWLNFTKAAIEDFEVRDFVAPPNVVFALVDPKSGKLATPDMEDARNEPFISGTEPTEFVPTAAPVEQFGLENY